MGGWRDLLGQNRLTGKTHGQNGPCERSAGGAVGWARRYAGLGGMIAHALFAGQGWRGASGKEAYKMALRP